MKKKNAICKHGVHLNIRCLACESDRRKRQRINEAIIRRAKSLGW